MIPMTECKDRMLYSVNARNFRLGVYHAEVNGFIGIRFKFGSTFLDTEYHWDTGAPHGTTKPFKELETLPEGILVCESLGTECSICKHPMEYVHKEEPAAGIWWKHTSGDHTGQKTCEGGWPTDIPNEALFKWLEGMSAKYPDDRFAGIPKGEE